MYESFDRQSHLSSNQSARFHLISIAIGSFILILFISSTITLVTKEALAIDDLIVYDDVLASGWQDWSYSGLTIDFATTSPTHTGTHSIAVTYTDGWSGFQVGYYGAYLDVNAYDTFQFRIHGGTNGGQSIQLILTLDGNSIIQAITPQAGTWSLVEIPLTVHSPREVYSIDFWSGFHRRGNVFQPRQRTHALEPHPPGRPPGRRHL
jgi:hypothetical protein